MDSIEWAAGILEGEGYFGFKRNKYPCVVCQMTDEDVIAHLHTVIGGAMSGPYYDLRGRRKPSWRVDVTAHREAAALMEKVLPYMGVRRSARIQEVLSKYALADLPGPGGPGRKRGPRAHNIIS